MGGRRWVGVALGLVIVAFAMSNARGVVGGSSVDQTTFQSEWPFSVAVVIGENAFCSGSLASPMHVLTAAHCASGESPSSLTVFTGHTDFMTSGTAIDVSSIEIHPNYNALTNAFDFAMLQLATSATSLPIRPITADESAALGTSFTGAFAGWGDTETEFAPTSTLNAASDSIGVEGGFYASSSPPSTCGGDSGGPLVGTLEGVPLLAGVTSFGDVNCDEFSAFGRLGTAADWVYGQVQPLTVSIANAKVREGNSGSKIMTFTVSLSRPVFGDVDVPWTTSDGSAKAGKDYNAAAAVVSIPTGSTSATLGVTILGDRRSERNEKFKVTLSDPVGAVIGVGEANGTIRDND